MIFISVDNYFVHFFFINSLIIVLYFSFNVVPSKGLIFDAMTINKSASNHFVVHNDGPFDLRFTILSKRQIQSTAAVTGRQRAPPFRNPNSLR